MESKMSESLKAEIMRGGQAYVRNLAAAEYAVSQGHFNLSKILRALATSQRTIALEAARLLADSTSETDILAIILDEVGEGKDITVDETHPLFEIFQQNAQVRMKIREIIYASQASLKNNPDVLENDVAQVLQVCLSCGMIIERGHEPIKYCPTCNAPRAEFVGFGPFYSSTPEHLGHLPPAKIKMIMAQTPLDVETAISSVSTEVLHYKPSVDEWNIAEIVGHLIETDTEFIRRVKLLIDENRPLIPPKTPWKLHEGKGYEIMKAQDLIKKFHITRQQTIQFINQLSEDDWNRTGFYSTSQTSIITTGSWLANHDLGHMAQIRHMVN